MEELHQCMTLGKVAVRGIAAKCLRQSTVRRLSSAKIPTGRKRDVRAILCDMSEACIHERSNEGQHVEGRTTA